MQTSPTSGPHDKQCGYNQGRIQINSGYRCTTASQRVISTWSSTNGLMNGGSQPLPGKYQKRTTEGEAAQAETQPPKSQCPRNQGRAKASRLRQTKGQRRQGPRRGRKRLHSRPTDNRNRLRERRRPPQIPSHRNQGEIRDQSTQAGGTRKKSKVQRASPDYTITEDDGEMITRMVQDFLAEDFDHATHHRDKLQKELAEMGQFLKKFGEVR
jgi:hypothetical protein